MTRLRQQLATRIRSLMEASATLDTQTKLSVRAGVSQSTVQRILSQDVAATVDSIEDMGKAFGLNPPSLLLFSESESGLLQLVTRLSQADKSEVQRFAGILLNRSQNAASPGLSFDLKRELEPGQRAANVKASSRPPKPDEKDQWHPAHPIVEKAKPLSSISPKRAAKK